MTRDYAAAVDALTRLRGIQGAMVVSGHDGMVVADSLMEGVKGKALAALAASLTSRVADIVATAECGPPRFLHLQAEEGALFVAPAAEGLLLVVLARRDVPLGLTRLEMLRVAERLA